ncbi:PQQ-binding-like beta-propeller repeat protein [Phragmitibacter flavus]|nr:PQQ-binding-like beta-propeller repeat protein [Phragmitibacter flavus]
MTTVLLALLLITSSLLQLQAQDPAAAATATAADTAPNLNWLHARGNEAMTGLSPTQLNLPLELVWTFTTGDKARKEGVLATPVVKDGKVYIGGQSGRFYCIDLATGKEVWKVEKESAFEGNAGFSGNLVIAGCVDSFVYAWDATTGEEKWKFETRGEIHAGINTWKNAEGKEHVLIGSYDNLLYCLDAATGTKLWEYETTNYINGAAAIYEDKVVFGGCDGMLYVIDIATGKEVKTIEVGAYIGNNIAVDKGIAYITHYGNKVAAFDFNDGTKLWEYGERDFPYYAAAAVSDEWVVAAGRDKRIRKLERATGKEVWEFRTRGDIDGSPLICANQHVLFGSGDGYFYALDLSNGEEKWRYEIGADIKVAPAVAGNFILVGADDGNVYCFKNVPSPAP